MLRLLGWAIDGVFVFAFTAGLWTGAPVTYFCLLVLGYWTVGYILLTACDVRRYRICMRSGEPARIRDAKHDLLTMLALNILLAYFWTILTPEAVEMDNALKRVDKERVKATP